MKKKKKFRRSVSRNRRSWKRVSGFGLKVERKLSLYYSQA